MCDNVTVIASDIPLRNIHVFSSANGREVAGTFICITSIISFTIYIQASSNMEGFQSRLSSVGSMKSATFLERGPYTLANLTTIARLVVWNLIQAVGMTFRLGNTSYARRHLVRSTNPLDILQFSVHNYSNRDISAAGIFFIRCSTYTSVLCQLHKHCTRSSLAQRFEPTLLTTRNIAQDTNFVRRIRSRDRRCCITGEIVGDDYTGFEAAHIFPLSETDIVSPTCLSDYFIDF